MHIYVIYRGVMRCVDETSSSRDACWSGKRLKALLSTLQRAQTYIQKNMWLELEEVIDTDWNPFMQ